MTAFRLVDLEEPKVVEVLRQMERFQPIGHAILNKTGIIQVSGIFVSISFMSHLQFGLTETKYQHPIIIMVKDFLLCFFRLHSK